MRNYVLSKITTQFTTVEGNHIGYPIIPPKKEFSSMRLLVRFGIPSVCPPGMKGLAQVPTSLFYLPFLFLDAHSVSRPKKIAPVIGERVALLFHIILSLGVPEFVVFTALIS